MKKTNKAVAMLALLAPMAIVTGVAVAFEVGDGSGGTNGIEEMDTALGVLVSYIDGPVGSIIAIVSFIVGLAIAGFTQSLIPVGVGVLVAILANYGPDIIQGAAGYSESAF
jgi:type IV secretory pathway VirB2 component (pilin)